MTTLAYAKVAIGRLWRFTDELVEAQRDGHLWSRSNMLFDLHHNTSEGTRTTDEAPING